jgi:hypothetical protein
MARLLSVVETPAYLTRATKLMDEAERIAVIDMIAAAPNVGVLIRGTGGLRKMRVPLQGRGKRGGGRVIYWFHSESYPAVLLWVFAKNDASDLTADQRRQLAAVTSGLLDDFRRRR